jgi:dihydrofolate reductase
MRRLVACEYVTLDGVMDDLDLWYSPYWTEEASNFKHDELFASDALLLGHGTYEEFVNFWPTAAGMGDYGERMNSMPKYVVSTTLDTVEWNAVLIKGSVVEAVSELKRQPGQDVLVFGSGQLLDTLMQHHLIDEYRLMVHPYIAGSGKRLFREGSEKRTLKLVETTPFSSGVVALTYQPDKR